MVGDVFLGGQEISPTALDMLLPAGIFQDEFIISCPASEDSCLQLLCY